jgi:ribosome-associated translation inhibitor RaiA
MALSEEVVYMQVRVSSPGNHLRQQDVDNIERDLAKIDRRLRRYETVLAEVRVSETQGVPGYHVILELAYGRIHLRANADASDVGRAVREAREDLLRQINDRSRRGHSWFAKRR